MEGDDQQEGQLEGVFNINDKVLGIVAAWERADPTEVVKLWIGELLLQLPRSFPRPSRTTADRPDQRRTRVLHSWPTTSHIDWQTISGVSGAARA